jgi:multiple sugar transport system permease protein
LFWALLFLSPWLVGFLIFTAGPMIASLVLSFMDYDVLNAPSWTGFENYMELFRDENVMQSLGNTFFYAALHVPLSMMIALGLASLLQRAGRRANLFRTTFYLPSITPAVAVGVLWFWLLNPQVGLVNRGLELIGIQGPGWTTDPAWIKPGIVVMSLWGLGNTVVIYYAALRNVPKEPPRCRGCRRSQQLAAVPLCDDPADKRSPFLHPHCRDDSCASALRRGVHDVFQGTSVGCQR